MKMGGYVAFFVAFFFVMLFVLFPLNRWKGTIEEMLSGQLDRRVTVGSVSAWGLTGLELHDVRISPEDDGEDTAPAVASEAADDGSEGSSKKKARSRQRETPLEIDRLSVRYSPMAALSGKLGVCFDMRIFDGSISGCYVDGSRSFLGKPRTLDAGEDGPTSSIRVKVRDIDLTRIDRIQSTTGLPFFGTAEADLDLTYEAGRPQTVEGGAEITIDDLRIGEPGGKVDLSRAGGGALSGEISFEPIDVGDLEVVLVGKEGKLVVEKLESKSQHIEIRGAGDMTMREPMLRSGLNIYVMFKFLPAYIDRSAMNKTIFSALDRIPQMRKAKRPDGYFGFLLKGDLRSGPKPLPSRSGPASPQEMTGPGASGTGIGGSFTPVKDKASPKIIGGAPIKDR